MGVPHKVQARVPATDVNQVALDLSRISEHHLAVHIEYLRFTDAAGKRLDFEIETWNFAGRSALIWVRLDSIQGNRDDQTLNIHYGKPDVFCPSRSQAVFDTAFKHAGVWHFSDFNSGGLLSDATLNLNHLRIGATAHGPGHIGLGRKIGSGDELAAAPSASLKSVSLTLSAWVHPEGAQAERAHLIWKQRSGSPDPAYSLTWLGKAGLLEFTLAKNGAGPGTVSARAPLPPGQDWVHVAATYHAQTGLGTLFIHGKAVQTFEEKELIDHGLPGDLVLGAQTGGYNARLLVFP